MCKKNADGFLQKHNKKQLNFYLKTPISREISCLIVFFLIHFIRKGRCYAGFIRKGL